MFDVEPLYLEITLLVVVIILATTIQLLEE